MYVLFCTYVTNEIYGKLPKNSIAALFRTAYKNPCWSLEVDLRGEVTYVYGDLKYFNVDGDVSSLIKFLDGCWSETLDGYCRSRARDSEYETLYVSDKEMQMILFGKNNGQKVLTASPFKIKSFETLIDNLTVERNDITIDLLVNILSGYRPDDIDAEHALKLCKKAMSNATGTSKDIELCKSLVCWLDCKFDEDLKKIGIDTSILEELMEDEKLSEYIDIVFDK